MGKVLEAYLETNLRDLTPPFPIEMPSLATIVAVLLNVRFPAVDACPIGIIADAANAKAFSVR